jgi:hypothetical protein
MDRRTQHEEDQRDQRKSHTVVRTKDTDELVSRAFAVSAGIHWLPQMVPWVEGLLFAVSAGIH